MTRTETYCLSDADPAMEKISEMESGGYVRGRVADLTGER